MNKKINFKNKFKLFNDLWSPKIIAKLNDYHFKLVKIKGEFIWHSHNNTDEAFIVLEGSMHIKLKNKTVQLNSGEMYIVNKLEEHKPYAKDECKILIIEPMGIINTGEVKNKLTKNNAIWI